MSTSTRPRMSSSSTRAFAREARTAGPRCRAVARAATISSSVSPLDGTPTPETPAASKCRRSCRTVDEQGDRGGTLGRGRDEHVQPVAHGEGRPVVDGTQGVLLAGVVGAVPIDEVGAEGGGEVARALAVAQHLGDHLDAQTLFRCEATDAGDPGCAGFGAVAAHRHHDGVAALGCGIRRRSRSFAEGEVGHDLAAEIGRRRPVAPGGELRERDGRTHEQARQRSEVARPRAHPHHRASAQAQQGEQRQNDHVLLHADDGQLDLAGLEHVVRRPVPGPRQAGPVPGREGAVDDVIVCRRPATRRNPRAMRRRRRAGGRGA